MKYILALSALIFFSACDKKESVQFDCTGGSGNYTMNYFDGTKTVNENTNTVVFDLEEGEGRTVRASDKMGKPFTMTLTVDGKMKDQQKGTTLITMEYTND